MAGNLQAKPGGYSTEGEHLRHLQPRHALCVPDKKKFPKIRKSEASLLLGSEIARDDPSHLIPNC
jgi:hypothetical protein